MSLHYPQDFPQDSATVVFNAIKNGTAITDRQLVAEAVWNLQGYAQRVVLGEGDLPTKSLSASQLHVSSSARPDDTEAPVSTDEEMADMLQAWCESPKEEKVSQGLPFTYQQLLQWAIKFLLALLSTAGTT